MIRLFAPDPAWQRLLTQEGVAFAVGLPDDATAVLVLNRRPAWFEAGEIRRFMERGGGLLSEWDSASELLDLTVTPTRVRVILPDDSLFFRCVGPVSVAGHAVRVAGAAIGSLDGKAGAIAARQIGAGAAVVLPFALAASLTHSGATPREFRSPGPRQPYETVSRTDGGEVRRLVANCLRWLLFRRGLPYIHPPYTPFPRGAFGFRIDSDTCSSAGLRRAHSVVESAGARPTWFVNTGVHYDDLCWFGDLARAGRDIQLHCHQHRVFMDERRDYVNLQTGLEFMRKAGISVRGAAAPYGDWNVGLARAYASLGIDYSSEFSCAFDDLPFRPLLDGVESPVLQIPVHPICTGSLAQARATMEEMTEYFTEYIRLQRARNEPCFLYEHPDAITRRGDLLSQVVREGISIFDGAQMTMTEYAVWWRRRLAAANTLRVRIEDDLITVRSELPLIVEMEARWALVEPAITSLRYDRLNWQDVTAPGDARYGTSSGHATIRMKASALARQLRKSLQERRA
jgi:hypothetical protein